MEPLYSYQSYTAKGQVIEEFEEIETLFGLKVLVKKGFFEDHEVQLLQGINRCLKAFGYEKVLQIPSNYQILSNLANSLKELFFSRKDDVKEQVLTNEKGQMYQNQNELKGITVLNNEKQLVLTNNQTISQKSQNQETHSNKQKQEKKQQQQQQQNFIYERKSESRNQETKQLQQQQQQQQKPKQNQQEKQNLKTYQEEQQQKQVSKQQLKPQKKPMYLEKSTHSIQSEIPSSLKPSLPSQQSSFDQAKLLNLVSSLSSKQSRLIGWFFVDHSKEISKVHSLQSPDGRKFWSVLYNIWQVVIKNKSSLYTLNDFQLTQAASDTEQMYLRIDQEEGKKCKFWMSESQYCLSTATSETTFFETIQAQKELYQPFDLRIIFYENNNNLNYFSAIIYGLLYNILAFNMPFDPIFEILTSNEVDFTIKLVLYHIYCMKSKNKMTNKELAVNLSLLFRFTRFNVTLQRFFKKSFPMYFDYSDIQRTFLHFTAKFNHLVIWQNVSSSKSSVHTTQLSQRLQNNIIFIDVTPNGCALNIFYQEQKIHLCQEAYLKQLKEKFMLSSV